ncbi:MAG: GatB/YqeY domain-containing protein [Flavobacteriaceae bacterium]|nr:GatB/YqeY domain-containing protein [Flavobacteriaceae bacterium]
MSLLKNLDEKIKDSIKSKESLRLEALRAIKSEVLLFKTSSNSKNNLSLEDEIKILQRLVKQRKESANIFSEQNRQDLVKPEEEQAKVIQEFLPEQLSEKEIEKIIIEIIELSKAQGLKDMGKVMGIASKKLLGKAEGKLISTIVKNKLQ